MKSAQQSAQKFVERAGAASGDYVRGAEQTSKDQAAAAIAAKTIWKQSLDAAAARGAFEKGLSRSGKGGWLEGVRAKGGERFAGGVSASSGKYATNSARFDGARGAANSMPRGMKGSPVNLQRVAAVVTALRTAKVGSGS